MPIDINVLLQEKFGVLVHLYWDIMQQFVTIWNHTLRAYD